VPLEALPTSSNTSLNRRDSLPSCRFSVLQSNCPTSTTMEVKCLNDARDIVTSKQNCKQNEVCIEYVNEQNNNFATCTSLNNVRRWTNESPSNSQSYCSIEAAYNTGGGKDLIFGVITYATNNISIQVLGIDVFMDGTRLDSSINKHGYSHIIKNYDGKSAISYCFVAGSDATVTAFAAALVNLQSV
ncbi:25784_t:CDS:1, partial [Gigaspora margarita]